MNVNYNQIAWVEKYRPQSVKDCILPKQVRNLGLGIVSSGEMPNLLLCGTAGTGKTALSRSLCNDLSLDYIFINASRERGIDEVRNKITTFASSMSFNGKRKVVILDEADQLTHDAQLALRAAIEEFAKNCSFILTCNYVNRLFEPLHSRCVVVDFKISPDEKKDILKEMYIRSCLILDQESIQYDKKVLLQFLSKYFPDFRRTINELQGYSKISNNVDIGILSRGSNIDIDELFRYIQIKSFNKIREWCVLNSSNDVNLIYRKLYNEGLEHVKNESKCEFIEIVYRHLYQSASVPDKELNLFACMLSILGYCEV